MNRRDFLKTSGTVLAFASIALSGVGCSSDGEGSTGSADPDGVTTSGNKITIDLSKFAGLNASGGFLLIASQKTVVINVGGSYKAFTSVCTHQGCDIKNFSNQKLICPCHGSEFTTTGAVAEGPAAQPLKEYSAALSGETLTVTKS